MQRTEFQPTSISTERTPAVGAVLEEIEHQIHDPPLGDHYLSEFLGHYRDAYDQYDAARRTVHQAVNARERVPSNLVRLAASHFLYLNMEDPSFPAATTGLDMRDRVDEMLCDPVRAEEYTHYSETYDLSTTVPQRAATLRPVSLMYEPRFGHQYTAVDIGTGLGYGPKMLAGLMPFEPIELVGGNITGEMRELTELQINTALSHFGNAPVGSIVAVDKKEWTPELRRHAYADCHYLTEWADETRRDRHHVLEAASSDKVTIIDQPVDLVETASIPEAPEGGFDVAMVSTVLNQIPETDREHFLENFKATLQPEGIGVIMEFGQPQYEGSQEVDVLQNWFSRQFPYRTILWDNKYPERGYRTLFAATNGRVRTLRASHLALEMLDQSYESNQTHL